MCKILIAEDEVWISALIRSIVKKGCTGTDIIGEAANGRKALEMAIELHPDIVLMDINMPVLSGLQVIEEAKKAGFSGKFIIISGYKDFSYVQQALRLGVEDYLLKPISDDKLCAVITRVCQKIEAEATATQQSSRNDALLKAQFLSRLLVNRQITMATANEIYGLSFSPGIFRCAVIKFSHHDLEHSYLLKDSVTEVVGSFRQALKKSMMPVCAEAFFLQQGSLLILFLNYLPGNRKAAGQKLELLFSTLLVDSAAYSLRVVMGVSEECDSFDQLSDTYRQAQYAVTSHPYASGKMFLYSDDGHRRKSVPPVITLSEKDLLTLNRALHSTTSGEVKEWFNSRFDSYVRQNGVVETEVLLMLDVSTVLLNTVLDAVQTLPLQISLNRAELLEQLEACSTVESLRNQVDALLQKAKEQIDQQLNAEDMTINRVMEYISVHLADPITLEETARVVHLSPSYLSEYFKTKTGTNFKDYVLERRLERATELLRQSNCRMKDVSTQCGYSDLKHFCKVFKKVMGVTPSEFRRIYG